MRRFFRKTTALVTALSLALALIVPAAASETLGAELSAREVSEYCALDESCQTLSERACEKYHLSMRAVNRVMKVSRTIADLAGEEKIGKMHVLEALGYRSLEGDYWR